MEYSITEILSLAKKRVFPLKTFKIANRVKKYTSILNFFTSIREFDTKPCGNVLFICKEKRCKLEAPLGDFSNINKHFINKPNDHPVGKEWYELYKKNSKSRNEKLLPENTFNLLKYFISSDTALDQINNQFLRKVLCPNIKVYSVWTFRYKLIPAVMKKLKSSITQKLNMAEFITLVTDGWTGQFSNMEYWAVCAQTVNSSWQTELITIGMVETPRGHSAEELQIAIQNIVNEFNFDLKIIDNIKNLVK